MEYIVEPIIKYIVNYPIFAIIIFFLLCLFAILLVCYDSEQECKKYEYEKFINYILKKYKIEKDIFTLFKDYKLEELKKEKKQSNDILIKSSFDEMF